MSESIFFMKARFVSVKNESRTIAKPFFKRETVIWRKKTETAIWKFKTFMVALSKLKIDNNRYDLWQNRKNKFSHPNKIDLIWCSKNKINFYPSSE